MIKLNCFLLDQNEELSIQQIAEADMILKFNGKGKVKIIKCRHLIDSNDDITAKDIISYWEQLKCGVDKTKLYASCEIDMVDNYLNQQLKKEIY